MPVLPDEEHTVVIIDRDDRNSPKVLLDVAHCVMPGEINRVGADGPDSSLEPGYRVDNRPGLDCVDDIASPFLVRVKWA
jgi:hypothetical protein